MYEPTSTKDMQNQNNSKKSDSTFCCSFCKTAYSGSPNNSSCHKTLYAWSRVLLFIEQLIKGIIELVNFNKRKNP